MILERGFTLSMLREIKIILFLFQLDALQRWNERRVISGRYFIIDTISGLFVRSKFNL